MNGIARLFYEGGGAVLPAKSPYDLEQVLDCANSQARQRGQVRLQVNQKDWIVWFSNGQQRCAACHVAVTGSVFEDQAHHLLCTRCTRHHIGRGRAPRSPRFEMRA